MPGAATHAPLETKPVVPVQAKQSFRFSWAELLRRVFAIDILQCDKCGAPMRIIAVIQESPVAHQILDHSGLEMSDAQSTGPPLQTPLGR